MTDLELKRLQLITELSPEERALLAPHLEALTLRAGSALFAEGEAGEGAFFVRSGALRLVHSDTAESVEIGPGGALGALSLVEAGPREVSAMATRDAELLVLRRSSFRRFRDDEPRAACALLEAILTASARLGRAALADARAPEGPDEQGSTNSTPQLDAARSVDVDRLDDGD